MPTWEEEQHRIWNSWLPPGFGEKLERVRSAVLALLHRNVGRPPLPHFTPHNEVHFQNVEDLIHKLIPDHAYELLTPDERFYLLASAWLHDIGMLPIVANPSDDPVLNKPQWIRHNHHTLSQGYIVNCPGDCGLDARDAEPISIICRFHRRSEDIERCPGYHTGNRPVVHDRDRIRIKLLAAYLRLADALDIGLHRTQAEDYALCLAYNIPLEAKFHWIRSRLVTGPRLDPDSHRVTVEFRKPSNIRDDEKALICSKIEYISKQVLQDLREELYSVSNVLMQFNRPGEQSLPYYLDVAPGGYTEAALDSQMLNDLRELVASYDIVVNPSATKLMQMVLSTVANIAGYQIREGVGEQPVGDAADPERTLTKLREFYTVVEENILRQRRCHFGLQSLLEKCRAVTPEAFTREQQTAFVKEIDGVFQNHRRSRRKVRGEAERFFAKTVAGSAGDAEWSVLLYGYSELVIKALCGLRDHLIRRTHPGVDPTTIYGVEMERGFSKRIRLFVCDGQAKTQTAVRDRLPFHDGAQYAAALHEYGFSEIVMIPDVVVGNILETMPIDFVMMGANGFNKDVFFHSAGHSTILGLTRHRRDVRAHAAAPLVLLVVTSEKYNGQVDVPVVEPDSRLVFRTFESHGFRFLQPVCEATGKEVYKSRDSIWLTRDRDLLEGLVRKGVVFYNPREDRIRIDVVDYILSDVGWFPVRAGADDATRIKGNVKRFLTAMEEEDFFGFAGARRS